MSAPSKKGIEQKVSIGNWEYFLQCAKEIGFKIGYIKSYKGKYKNISEQYTETEAILYSEKTGIIIYAETYEGERVRNVKICGEFVRKKARIPIEQSRFLTSCSKANYGRKGISFVRQPIVNPLYILQQLQRCDALQPIWQENHSLEFENAIEKTENFGLSQEITQRKIEESSPEVRKIILGS